MLRISRELTEKKQECIQLSKIAFEKKQLNSKLVKEKFDIQDQYLDIKKQLIHIKQQHKNQLRDTEEEQRKH